MLELSQAFAETLAQRPRPIGDRMRFNACPRQRRAPQRGRLDPRRLDGLAYRHEQPHQRVRAFPVGYRDQTHARIQRVENLVLVQRDDSDSQPAPTPGIRKHRHHPLDSSISEVGTDQSQRRARCRCALGGVFRVAQVGCFFQDQSLTVDAGSVRSTPPEGKSVSRVALAGRDERPEEPMNASRNVGPREALHLNSARNWNHSLAGASMISSYRRSFMSPERPQAVRRQ